ncbi:MAG: glycosyltransferase [Promethearchaeota archaeon]
MNKILTYFQNHPDFNVYSLNPIFKNSDYLNLKIQPNNKHFFYKQLNFFSLTLVPFTDFNPLFIFKAYKILKKYNIDLIHVEFPFGIFALRLITRKPISYNSHNVEYIFTNEVGKYYPKVPKIFRSLLSFYVYLIEKFAVKFVQNVNVLSKKDIKDFIDLYKINKNKLFLTKIGYNEQIFKNPLKKEIARKKLGLNSNNFIVIFHGSDILPNKEAVQIIRNKISLNIHDKVILFLIAGKVMKKSEKDNFKAIGFVEDLNLFLYSADVALMPIIHGSGVKIKGIDYLSARIPIITTKSGAEGLDIKDDVTGFIIKNNNYDEMIKKILLLKNNPQKISQLKKNIEKLLITKFDWTKILKNLMFRYKKIIESNSK